MNAIAIKAGRSSPEVIDVDVPDPDDGEALVRTLRVGIDGTDFEVLEGNHGGFPDGEDYQILGHEAVGVVDDPNGTDLEEGQLVVPTVRRPPDGSNDYFERGEPDMAPPDACLERGIDGAHGFMSEYFTSPAEYLIPVPTAFAETGVLVEPMSNTAKALEHAFASRSMFDWEPDTVLVLGNGPLGLLTLAMLDSTVDRSYCLGRRDRPDPTIDVIEELDATYVDSRETPVSEFAGVHEPADLVFEATGYAKHAYETVDALAPNGVGVLLGLPGDWTFDIDGGRLHRELVLENKALLGSVNSHVRHFESATESLERLPDWFLERIITDTYAPSEVDDAFTDDDDRIKTVVEFDTL
ncbi:glucose 1-dehydrogenase [Halobiforma nitratireducens]|uniref:Glucose 1-dehydrogenase n=1 Tax=Halobiforma nitratireducens JCM 10879 TaxID=1227454 RepID=M0MPC2_9EURY|nr:glucose 1-dehydrogenase [Halobiforma nitratireducens]EMA46569.1 Alcohol dehydrogenase GroES domain protein [Halobiforma nitratireducens JCM 10879]